MAPPPPTTPPRAACRLISLASARGRPGLTPLAAGAATALAASCGAASADGCSRALRRQRGAAWTWGESHFSSTHPTTAEAGRNYAAEARSLRLPS